MAKYIYCPRQEARFESDNMRIVHDRGKTNVVMQASVVLVASKAAAKGGDRFASCPQLDSSVLFKNKNVLLNVRQRPMYVLPAKSRLRGTAKARYTLPCRPSYRHKIRNPCRPLVACLWVGLGERHFTCGYGIFRVTCLMCGNHSRRRRSLCGCSLDSNAGPPPFTTTPPRSTKSLAVAIYY